MTSEFSNPIEEINRDLIRFSGRSMSGGAEKSPVLEFLGDYSNWDVKRSNFQGQAPNVMVVFKKLEVKQTRNNEAYPFDTVELYIKHSTAPRSGFGFFQAGLNRALGIPDEESDLDLGVGKRFHLNTIMHNWGKIPNAQNADANGDVWGEIWDVKLVGSNPIPTATGSTSSTSSPTATGTNNGSVEDFVLTTLNGKNKSDWLRVVASDSRVNSDGDLLQSILGDEFLSKHIASGKVTTNPDSTFTVN